MEDIEINNRIQYVIDQYFNCNVSAFCRDTSIAYSTVADIIGDKKTSPTNKTIQKILTAKSVKIDPDWLMQGKGNELKSEEKGKEAEYDLVELPAIIRQKDQQIDELTKRNNQLTDIADYMRRELDRLQKSN